MARCEFLGTQLVLEVKINGLFINVVIAIGTVITIKCELRTQPSAGSLACVRSFMSRRSREVSLLLCSAGQWSLSELRSWSKVSSTAD